MRSILILSMAAAFTAAHGQEPDVKTGGIVMFGDSTTAPRATISKVYAARVEETLRGGGFSLPVLNAGVGGNTTRDALDRLNQDVLRHRPRVVVIQFGINDATVDVWKKPPATTPRVPLAEFLRNIRRMISLAREQDARVIIMTTNPLRWTSRMRELYGKPPYDPHADDGFDALHLAVYNDALRALASELKAPLVDVRAAYPAFAARHGTTVDGLLLDGVHPNDLGHQLVAELLAPPLLEMLR